MDLVVAVMWGHFQRRCGITGTTQLSTTVTTDKYHAYPSFIKCFPQSCSMLSMAPRAAVPPCRCAALCQTFTEVDATYCTYTCKFYENPICGGPPSFWGVSSSKKHGQMDRNGQLTWKQGETQKKRQSHTTTYNHYVTFCH